MRGREWGDDEVRQEVSGGGVLLVELCRSASRSSDKFHGKKEAGLSGT